MAVKSNNDELITIGLVAGAIFVLYELFKNMKSASAASGPLVGGGGGVDRYAPYSPSQPQLPKLPNFGGGSNFGFGGGGNSNKNPTVSSATFSTPFIPTQPDPELDISGVAMNIPYEDLPTLPDFLFDLPAGSTIGADQTNYFQYQPTFQTPNSDLLQLSPGQGQSPDNQTFLDDLNLLTGNPDVPLEDSLSSLFNGLTLNDVSYSDAYGIPDALSYDTGWDPTANDNGTGLGDYDPYYGDLGGDDVGGGDVGGGDVGGGDDGGGDDGGGDVGGGDVGGGDDGGGDDSGGDPSGDGDTSHIQRKNNAS